MVEREYEYRLKAGRTLVRAILCGAGALWFGYMALNNDRGLILLIIPLSQKGATIFYGVIGGLAAVFAAYDAISVSRRKSLRQRIAFANDGLLVPRSLWSTEEKLIPYESVLDVKEFTEPNSVAIIRHREGEFTLELDLLADERTYAEIVRNLAARVHAAKGGNVNPSSDSLPSKSI
jgi:hypothetical protein